MSDEIMLIPVKSDPERQPTIDMQNTFLLCGIADLKPELEFLKWLVFWEFIAVMGALTTVWASLSGIG